MLNKPFQINALLSDLFCDLQKIRNEILWLIFNNFSIPGLVSKSSNEMAQTTRSRTRDSQKKTRRAWRRWRWKRWWLQWTTRRQRCWEYRFSREQSEKAMSNGRWHETVIKISKKAALAFKFSWKQFLFRESRKVSSIVSNVRTNLI